MLCLQLLFARSNPSYTPLSSRNPDHTRCQTLCRGYKTDSNMVSFFKNFTTSEEDMYINLTKILANKTNQRNDLPVKSVIFMKPLNKSSPTKVKFRKSGIQGLSWSDPVYLSSQGFIIPAKSSSWLG